MAESFRQEKDVEDNRSSKFWLDDDLQLQSVEDRLRMYEKWASKCEGLGAHQLVQQGSEPSPTQARCAQSSFAPKQCCRYQSQQPRSAYEIGLKQFA